MKASLSIIAGLLGLSLAVVACGDAEEEPVPDVTVTPSGNTAPIATPSPSLTPVASTPAPAPSGWSTYADSELGFSMPVPKGLRENLSVIELPERDGLPATQLRVVSFDRADNVPVVGVSSTPNPTGLSLDEWIRARPGWPCDPGASPTCTPELVSIGGETGIRFSIDVVGDPAATIYFAHGGMIYSLSGNVFGSGEAGYGPAITESDFQVVVRGFRFSK